MHPSQPFSQISVRCTFDAGDADAFVAESLRLHNFSGRRALTIMAAGSCARAWVSREPASCAFTAGRDVQQALTVLLQSALPGVSKLLLVASNCQCLSKEFEVTSLATNFSSFAGTSHVHPSFAGTSHVHPPQS
jgi:hypothetical protein